MQCSEVNYFLTGLTCRTNSASLLFKDQDVRQHIDKLMRASTEGMEREGTPEGVLEEHAFKNK